jgi:hypothetical protein
MKLSIILLFLALASYGEFNYKVYIPADFDSLIDSTPKAIKLDKNAKQSYDIYKPEKIKLTGKISRMPIKYDTLPEGKLNAEEKILKSIMKAIPPAIKYVTEIETKKGRKFVMLVQSGLVEAIYNEAQIGTNIELFYLHYFNDEEGPGLLICDFKTIKSP